MTRRHWWIVVGLVAAVVTSALADLTFQAVEEWSEPYTFNYPSGRARILSDGNDIQLMNRAWTDTTGKGIAHHRYYSTLSAAGDSVGVWLWRDVPPGKYYVVERSGTDSLFSAPDYLRFGFDTAPEQSVDSSAVLADAIDTVHLANWILDPTSAQYLIVDESIDGPMIKPGEVALSHMSTGSVDPSKLVTGKKYFTIAGGDSVEPAIADIGALSVRDHATFGATRADSAFFAGPVTFGDFQILGGQSTVRDSFPISTNYGWFTVPGNSDLMTDGYQIHCTAVWDHSYWVMYNEVGGTTYKQTLYAAPIRQYGALGSYPATDSVFVTFPSAVAGRRMPFCLTCYGVDP